MKNENLLKMLGEIDEKHLNDANRDIERWLEDMNGVKVTVERPKKSPWKLAAALSCSAAAVIGAFVLILNVPKIGNIGNTGNTVNSGGENVQSAAFSEMLQNYEITNLDYSNAVITENTPASGQWRRLSYEIPGIDENSPERMAKIAEAYGATINKDDIMARMMWNKWTHQPYYIANEPFSQVYSPEYDELQFTSDVHDKVPYNSIYYLSNDIYIEIAEPGYGWIELDNRGFLNSYFDWNVSYGGVWRTNFNGKPIHYVAPDDAEETVILNGKTVKIADAVKNAQKYFSENTALFPQVFDAEISGLTVYNYENGNQGLELIFRYYYDGMPYQPTPVDELEKNYSTHKAGVYAFLCGMLNEDTIDWIWFKTFDGATEFSIEDCEVSVSQEDALKLVSMRLDPNETMLVREIQLLYGERRTNGGRTALAEPTWMIVLAENEIWDANKTIAYVSAVDGSVRTFYDRKPIM